ncbi:MAG: ABC transporter permease [Thermoflexales bacterium]|nr:ABC transporter permease [Thermoflexales bacterium]MCS7323784.1 ABC transporter permease [Thermoflexales bacterium]MCX7939770.1 ABC transporter permease [Thermoflexales bacterium]MDW8053892.1 ABC transporter permease [Anaerolineae bacterium]MDW8292433.1 ABC transporter permease [Anaerolineae bacterium]
MAVASAPQAHPLAAAYRLVAVVAALVLLMGLVLLVGESPTAVFSALIGGAFGTADQIGRVVNTLTVLLLCSAGLVFTFNAGLYNLGVEGQVTMGAIATTFTLRLLGDVLPAPLAIALSIAAGALGGVGWGLLAGVLKVYGRVSEIFAGLGLNFIAQGAAIYLVFGPWKRPGVASTSGTEPFGEHLWLGTFGRTEATPVGVALALASLLFTIVVMQRTYFGLRLRAVGHNPRAADILGVSSSRHLLGAFALCGVLAGVGGALQVVGNYHRLIPTISGGLGFLGLLVVMLAGFNALFVLPIAFFFSALNVGSLQLPLVLQRVDSSLSGVIQGVLVLAALIGRGLAQRRAGGTA